MLTNFYSVSSRKIQMEHSGIRIAHLSDLHVKSSKGLANIANKLNKLNVNLVLLTGDYVCYNTDYLNNLRNFIQRIKCELKLAVLGNHDHEVSAHKVISSLTKAGCRVLINESLKLNIRGKPFFVIGIDDPITGKENIQKSFASVNEAGTQIVISHSGDISNEIRDNALILSGHTHGGQIIVPIITNLILNYFDNKYFRGFYRVCGQILYVSNGFGDSFPMRIGTMKEISIFELKNGPLGWKRV